MSDKPPQYLKGIDVSHHQHPAKMDYVALFEEGYRWCIARAAYGERPDDTFVAHCEKAKAAGMLVGGYTFYRQTQGWEVQGDTFRRMLETVDQKVGLDILPVIDLEWNERYDGKVKPDVFNRGGRNLVEALSNTYNRHAICYLAPGFYQTLGNPEWLLEYPWWIAHYTQDEQPWCPFKDWDMWQFTGSGNTTGYSGDLDLNRARSVPLVNGRFATPRFPTGVDTSEPAPSKPPENSNAHKSEIYRQIALKHGELQQLYTKLSVNLG